MSSKRTARPDDSRACTTRERWLHALLALAVLVSQAGWIGHFAVCPHGDHSHGVQGDTADRTDGTSQGCDGDHEGDHGPAPADDHDCPFQAPLLSTKPQLGGAPLFIPTPSSDTPSAVGFAVACAPVDLLGYAPKHSPPTV